MSTMLSRVKTASAPNPEVTLLALAKGFQAKLFPNNNVLPKIKVLVVEDNPINQLILKQFLNKNHIPFTLILNGRDALKEWRKGGYQLILMDIQLPFISGIYCAKEIRRLEKVNGIGYANNTKSKYKNRNSNIDSTISSDNSIDKMNTELHEIVSEEMSREESPNPLTDKSASDKLDVSKFKQPVIIVALTANSFTEDRDNALAAGCNDFVVKPVNLNWLNKKFTEWGCIQALINYEGWEGVARRGVEGDSRLDGKLRGMLERFKLQSDITT